MKISRIPLAKPSCIIIICLLYQIGCASTKTVPVHRDDYGEFDGDQVVYVYLKSGEFYTLTHVEEEREYLTGIIQYSDRAVKIRIADINYVTTEKRTVTALGVIEGLLIATAVIGLVVLIACAVGSQQ